MSGRARAATQDFFLSFFFLDKKHYAPLAGTHAQCGLTLLPEDTPDVSPTDFHEKLMVVKRNTCSY